MKQQIITIIKMSGLTGIQNQPALWHQIANGKTNQNYGQNNCEQMTDL